MKTKAFLFAVVSCLGAYSVAAAPFVLPKEQEKEGELRSPTDYYNPYLSIGKKVLNGHSVSVVMSSWDESDKNEDKAKLRVYIELEIDAPPVRYDELKVEVLDDKDKSVEFLPIARKPETLEHIHTQRCGYYDLQLKKGQKVKTVKIKWKDSEQTYLMSEGELFQPEIVT